MITIIGANTKIETPTIKGRTCSLAIPIDSSQEPKEKSISKSSIIYTGLTLVPNLY